jgi:hypothetical protein
MDGVCSDGCECATTGTSASCPAPTALGALQIGQSTTYTGNLVPLGNEAYLSVTFNGNMNYTYHPRITLSAGASEFAFDVIANCQGTLIACGVEGGGSSSSTDWEEYYSAGDPNNVAQFQPIGPVGSNGTVIIHVYRRAGKPVSCNTYTLTITN